MLRANKSRAFVLRAGVAGAIAALGLALGSMAVPTAASATPTFAAQTGKPCGACHVNKAGGGKLTAAGEKFKKDHK